MNVVKCANQHFFDGDSYMICPYCGASVMPHSPAALAAQQKPEKKKGLIGRLKKDKHPSQPAAPQQEWNQQPAAPWAAPQAPLQPQQPQQPQPVSQQVPPAAAQGMPAQDYSSRTATSTDPRLPSSLDSSNDKTIDLFRFNSETQSAGKPQEVTDCSSPYPQQDSESAVSDAKAPAANPEPASLQETIQRASASNGEKTIGLFESLKSQAQETAPEKAVPSADPVVGWLVAISGKYFGQSFQISAGKNSIGRSDENRIVLNADQSISRIKHAIIIYEPKKRIFFLQPGDSSGLTYLNGDLVIETKQIMKDDIIEIGDSKLMLIPLCGESFSWEDYIQKD